jgi:hypothetical protein
VLLSGCKVTVFWFTHQENGNFLSL